MRFALGSLLAATLMAGCATARIRPPATAAAPGDAADSSLSTYARGVRALSGGVRPRQNGALVAETWSQDLAAAITRHAAMPTPAAEVGLAQAYVRAGILDKAFDHFASAARHSPNDGAAWDGLARIWRDWGFPHVGLGDAYRAVWAAPHSPATHNTLGTILQSLGKGREARARFARAVELDAAAAYARNNLCYSWLMDANTDAATLECGRALAVEPGLVPARNNLALTRAVAGDLAGAAEIFGAAGGEAAARYNVGIIHLAQRRYSAAADAFEQAVALRPSLVLAGVRARQARGRATEVLEHERSLERR